MTEATHGHIIWDHAEKMCGQLLGGASIFLGMGDVESFALYTFSCHLDITKS